MGASPTVTYPAAARRRSLIPRFLALAALAALIAAVVVIVTHAPSTGGTHAATTKGAHKRIHKVPPYWIVRPGDTLTKIAAKTGLTIEQLEARNANTDPQSLVPGQRLLLWAHPPKPRPKPPGPRFWIVREGQSFGSIAARTGINLAKLEQLNPHLKATTLQPGDRVRLRP